MSFLFYDIVLFACFSIIAAFFLIKNKKRVKREGIIYLFKTQFGISFMDSVVNKYRKFFNLLSVTIIIIGFAGMIVMIGLLVFSCYKMAVMTEIIKTPPIVPLLPWIPFPGLPTLYFTYWILAVFVLAVVHEGSHGIFSRLNSIKVKSSGFGFLGPLPLAFVEPDEKELNKASTKAQLSIFAAGPVSNFVLAVITIIFISFVLNPVYSGVLLDAKVAIASVNETGPAYAAGVKAGEIVSINNASTVSEFIEVQSKLKPNQTVEIKDKENTYNIITTKNPANESIGYMGIGIKPKLQGLNKGFPYLSAFFFWVFITNIFVGLSNLLPLPIVDGGRMVYAAALSLTKSKKKAEKISKNIYLFSVFLFVMLFVVWIARML